MDLNTVLSSQGFTKVLNTGQLLRRIASRACVGKRARDHAVSRAALSQTDDNVLQIVRRSVDYMQPSSRLTPDKFYQTILDVVFDWIATSPNGRDAHKRVEIHYHHHGSEMVKKSEKGKPTVAPAPSPRTDSAETIPPTMVTDLGDGHKAKKSNTKKRIRVRFATFALRDDVTVPWQCPYSEANCTTCTQLWQRRFRCNKASCKKHHYAGAHTECNRAEEKFIRAQHAQFKKERATAPVPSAETSVAPTEGSAETEESQDSPSAALAESAGRLNFSDADYPPLGAAKHTLDWVAEVEEKRGKY